LFLAWKTAGNPLGEPLVHGAVCVERLRYCDIRPRRLATQLHKRRLASANDCDGPRSRRGV
jgi:hypothetical protein